MQRGTQGNISKFWITFLISCYIAVLVTWCVDVFGHPLPDTANTFLMMGYAKAAITFVKYLPQVYLNWKRKSCEGWSFGNVFLDFCGGSLSFAQSALNSIALGEPFFDPGAFNLVKFILSITSIFFDSIFFFQFWLYKGNKPKKTLAEVEGEALYGEEGKGILDEKDDPHAIAKSNTISKNGSDY